MVPRFRRRAAALAVVFALLVVLLTAAPAPAYAGVLGLPIPNPLDVLGGLGGDLQDLVGKVVGAVLKAVFGGLQAKVGLEALRWLVAHPVYSDGGAYPGLARLEGYMADGAWGLLALVFTISGFRYWTAGLTASGSYEAVTALTRAAAAAGALVAWPALFANGVVATNLFTHALLGAPGVQAGMAKAIAGALAANFTGLGIGAIATVAALLIAVALIVTKIILSTLLAVLFVAAPLAIALWPLQESAWAARTLAQGLIAVLVWPVIWCLCFAVFAATANEAVSFHGDLASKLIEPFVSVAALYTAFKLPLLVGRQAMLAGLTPNFSGAAMRSYTLVRARSHAPAASAGKTAAEVAA